MLRISNSQLRLVSQGYHFNERGKKFVRIFMSLQFVKIQVKIQPHKEMHIKSISVDFPYRITDNWVEFIFYPGNDIMDYIDERLNEIWFV